MARPWRTEGSVEHVIHADPHTVYDIVADVTSTGERSNECRRVEWLPGAQQPVPGARFRGYNRFRFARWSRVCEIVEAERGETFGFRTVPERFDPSRRDSTTWRYDLTPHPDGTLVRHSYEITVPPLRPFKALYGVLLPQHRDMRPAMRHTLYELARAATSLESSGL
jgi:hypothetical protein